MDTGTDPERSTAEWYRKAFVILHIDHHTTADMPVGRDADPDETRRLVELADPDVLQMHAKGNPGWTTYPSQVGHTPPGLERDVLRVWTDVARQLNKPFSAYYNIGRDGEIMARKPDFNRLNAAGHLLEKAICYHTGVAEDYVWPMVREIVETYRPAGFWFDGSVFTVQVCYCESCLRRWRELSGRDAPRSPADPDWARYQEMHRDIYREFIRDTVAMIHQVDPECQVAFNWAYTFRMPEKPPSGLAYLTGDIANGVERLTVEAALMDAQGLPFDLMTTTWTGVPKGAQEAERQRAADNRPLPQGMQPKSDAHIQQEAAVIISRGGRYSAWDDPTDGSGLVEERLEALGKLTRWLRERQPFCQGTENVPDVSILLLSEDHYARGSSHPMCFPSPQPNGPAVRVSQCLDDRHITYEICPAWRVEEGCVRGSLVILEDPCVLSDTHIAQLSKLVEAGATLLASGQAAIVGGPAFRRLAGLSRVAPKPVPAGYRVAAASDGQRPAMPIAGPLHVIDQQAGEVLLWAEAEIAPRHPLLTRVSLGAGSVFFCAAPVLSSGQVAAENDPVEGAAALVDLVLGMVLPEPERAVTTTAPASVHLTCRKRNDLLVVHLVNRAKGEIAHSDSALARRIVSVPPTAPCTLSVRVCKETREVTLEPGARRPTWHFERGRVQLDVPAFDIHEMAVLRLG